ncbi:MAG: phage portal protein, partial [Pseudomonadota bacterium]
NNYTQTDTNSKNPTRVEKIDDLRILNLTNPGDDIESFESKTPNREYVGYLKHELQAIAAAINISYEVLMLIFTDGNYSSQRAALIHNKHTFQSWTQWVIGSGMDRICNWRIAKAMKRGQLPEAPKEDITSPDGRVIAQRSEWHKKTWSIPYFDWVDPQAQATADKETYNLGTTSLKRLNAARGQDRDDVFAEKGSDIEAAIDEAARISEATGEEVTWRDLISSKVPGQL